MRSLWRSLVGLLVVFACAGAQAAFPPNTYNSWSFPSTGLTASTPAAVCELVRTSSAVGTNATIQTFAPGSAANKYTCIIKRSVSNGGSLYGSLDDITAVGALSCPANSTGTSSCTCTANYDEVGGACVIKQVTCTAGQTVNSGYYDAGTNIAGGPAAVTCQNGCTAVFDGTFPGGSAMVGGVKHYFAKGSYVNFGSKCDSGNGVGVPGGAGNAPAAVADVPPDSCGPGKVMGTVNGKPTCADAGNGSTTPTPSTPETSTDTKKEETTSSTTTNPDGSKTTTNTTIITGVDGGKSTRITTTTVNADGTPRSTTTTETGAEVKKEAEEAEQSKCEKNAADEGCGGEPAEVEASGLYTKKEKTIASIFEGAKTTLQASPVGSATSNFFTVSGGGSCPTATWNIPYLRTTVQMDAFCTPSALNMLLVIKGCLLLVASFMAFRIAVE